MAFDKQSVIKHPLARSERLLIENIDDETVIYDEESKAAHALKPLAAAVFSFADGKNSLGDIAELVSYRLGAPVTEAQVSEAVAELDGCALLDAPVLDDGLSRRDALKRFGAVGVAAGAGTMLISSIAAPAAFAGLAANGANYVCGTNANPVTGQGPAAGQSWPQPPVSSGWANYIGSACNVNYNCVVGGVSYKNVPASLCQSGGFCVNASNSYYAAKSSGDCSGSCPTHGTTVYGSNSYCSVSNKPGILYYSVPESLCFVGTGKSATGGAFCVDQSNDYDAVHNTQQSCQDSAGTWIDLSQYWRTGTATYTCKTGGTWITRGGNTESGPAPSGVSNNGKYVGIPCDGNVDNAHYQCAEVACVSSSLAAQSPFISDKGSFLSTYSVSGEFSGWPSKYCANVNCNHNGTCS